MVQTEVDEAEPDPIEYDTDYVEPDIPVKRYPHDELSEKEFQTKYASLVKEIDQKRKSFEKWHSEAASVKDKKDILEEARRYVFDVAVNKLLPFWYGTRWEFYGKSNVPRKNAIACGVFVSTTLNHAGFKFKRMGLGIQTAENIIKNLVYDNNRIKRFSKKPIEHFVKMIQTMGDGLFIVGLDNHVGLIVNINDEVQFVHSSNYEYEVLSEKPETDNPLNASKYRVVGKLLSNAMIEKWVLGKTFPIKYDYFKKARSKGKPKKG